MSFLATARTGTFRGVGFQTTDSSTVPVFYARVIDVVLDSSHPSWKNIGGTQGLYGVFYQLLYVGDKIRNTDTEEVSQFAYCYPNTFRRVPIPGEIVLLRTGVSVESSEKLQAMGNKTYWIGILPVWNSPHLNLFPDKNNLLDIKPFEESDKVKPLQLGLGDVSVEGRHGQSIRFGGSTVPKSPVASSPTNNNKPYIIVSVGHGGQETPQETVFEDVNKDSSSLYIVSDHKIPLTQANEKRKGWKDKRGPTKASEYLGKQIVGNSGRIYLNAKDLDIELTAKEAVGINAKVVAVDGEEYVGFDATKLYWGTNSFGEGEPCLKGKTTTSWLERLVSQLDLLLSVMGKPLPPVPWVGAVAGQSISMQGALKGLKSQLSNLHSKKIFVE